MNTIPNEQPAAALDDDKKRDVLNADDIMQMVPKLRKHPKLVNRIVNFLWLNKVNDLHARHVDHPGPEFVRGLLTDLDIKLKVDNEDVLNHLPEGAFITVSNHHFGALDGIILIDLIASRRPRYKVMVNMILNHIRGMRPNFIAVDAMASDDPKKKAVSMRGIKEVILNVRKGDPVGFFPAGAVAKVNWRLRLKDRQWQPNIIRLIDQLDVPVIPIFFHGSNSWFFNFMGVVCWQVRSIMHPHEVFKKKGKTFRVTIGDPISVEEQARHKGSLEEFGTFLRERTYSLRDIKSKQS
ncbi:MAG: 1-acyl-sn-glycerol-3-phosphate acyltransferase [Muribaculaceae bacterium]|nr:1-acyl-sn-glycerol-3-phosphate acyltransferase [Muribaculaceae bacterium]MDE6832068.1 1-acyl-sn-glycerol-3-phosphate acyltransferase [Muribaculaceae bacterium]